MMEVGYDSAELETVNLHTTRTLINFRWHAVRFEVPLPVWRNQQRIAALLKRSLGVGGSARGGEILIQGNLVDQVKKILSAQGYKVK